MTDLQPDSPVEPERARLLIARHEAVSIDLRGEQASETGHAPGAAIVMDGNLDEAIDRSRAGEDMPVLVFCEDGKLSGQAAQELAERGIDAAPVKGGWDNWVATGQPVQPRRETEFEGPDLSKQPGT